VGGEKGGGLLKKRICARKSKKTSKQKTYTYAIKHVKWAVGGGGDSAEPDTLSGVPRGAHRVAHVERVRAFLGVHQQHTVRANAPEETSVAFRSDSSPIPVEFQSNSSRIPVGFQPGSSQIPAD